jgi:hypothetical protein
MFDEEKMIYREQKDKSLFEDELTLETLSAMRNVLR